MNFPIAQEINEFTAFHDELAGLVEPTPQELHPARRFLRQRERQAKRERDEVIVSHLPLVRAIAGRYARNPGFSLEDAVQHGTLGLLKAAADFDPKNGSTLGTYARLHIFHAVEAYIRTIPIIRIPQGAHELELKIRHLVNCALREGRARPSDATIAFELDVKLEQVRAACSYPVAVTISDDEVRDCWIGTDLLHASSATPAEIAEAAELRSLLPRAIARSTTPGQRKVIEALQDDQGEDRALTRAAAVAGVSETTARTHLARIAVGPLSTDPLLECWVRSVPLAA